MVIKTATKSKRPSLPSKRPFGSVVDIGRQVLKSYGYYQKFNLQRYDPQVYVDKYTYKPRKRVAGYLGKAIQSKTSTSYNKFGKAYRGRKSNIVYDKRCHFTGKGSNCSF